MIRSFPSEPARSFAVNRRAERNACKRIYELMVISCQIVLATLVMFGLTSHRAQAEELRWRDASSLEVEGKGRSQTAGPFDRLPDSAKSKGSPTTWQLNKETAGVCICFVTDAAAVSVRWSLTSDVLAMPHIPATRVSGRRDQLGAFPVTKSWAYDRLRLRTAAVGLAETSPSSFSSTTGRRTTRARLPP